MNRHEAAAIVVLVLLLLVPGCAEISPHRAAAPPVAGNPYPPGVWVPLFDGLTLTGWRVLRDFDFANGGEVAVADGAIVLPAGGPMTGIVRDGVVPRDDYELSLEAQRLEGSDFFCGLTFPVGEEHCTLIIGGWGGGVVGLSNVDGSHAAENETTTGLDVEDRRWYAIRLRVTAAKIEVWIDGEPTIDLDRPERRFDIWIQQQPARPLGITTYYTSAALREIRVRRL